MIPGISRNKKNENSSYSLRSRLTSLNMSKNSENSIPGLNQKPHLILFEGPVHNDPARNLQSKRKTIFSPQGPLVKRTAFSDVTNAIQRLQLPGFTNEAGKSEKTGTVKKLISKKSTTSKVVTKSTKPLTIPEETTTEDENSTLYMSALEEVFELQTQSQPEAVAPTLVTAQWTQPRSSSEPPVLACIDTKEASVAGDQSNKKSTLTELVNVDINSPTTSYVTASSPLPSWQMTSPDAPPPGVKDFDKETSQDTFAVADYAPYIFCYLRTREPFYQVRHDFLSQHELLSNDIRALCVDWMVEVQETLELNHETLYLGVRSMDLFLSNPKPSTKNYRTPSLPIRPSKLRLLACAALLLAAQYDERLPPPAEDWLQMCDKDYTIPELNTMQQQLFCALNFDLGSPLSYRFLRRYARACKIEPFLLTLARYILESALLDSQFSSESDSKMAAAALWLAICMQKQPATLEERLGFWTSALEHYSGYTVRELQHLASRLNAWIRILPTKYLRTVYSKYSHRVFLKVALTPALEEM